MDPFTLILLWYVLSLLVWLLIRERALHRENKLLSDGLDSLVAKAQAFNASMRAHKSEAA